MQPEVPVEQVRARHSWSISHGLLETVDGGGVEVDDEADVVNTNFRIEDTRSAVRIREIWIGVSVVCIVEGAEMILFDSLLVLSVANASTEEHHTASSR